MEGLLKEATELLEDIDKGTEVRDVAIISAAQKVEDYEIASYGTLFIITVLIVIDQGVPKGVPFLQISGQG